MSRLDTLFDQFLRERTYIKSVTPKDWYRAAWLAFKKSQSSAASGGDGSVIFTLRP